MLSLVAVLAVASFNELFRTKAAGKFACTLGMFARAGGALGLSQVLFWGWKLLEM